MNQDQPKTPQQRAAQQRSYEQAMALLGETSPDYEAASRFLLQCVLNEPGNSIFIDAYLTCWNRRYEFNHTGSFWRNFAPTYAWRQAVTNGDISQLFEAGLVLLQSNPWRQDVLISLSNACQTLNHLEAADRYLVQALTADADSIELLKSRGRLHAEIGNFDSAVEIWRKVNELAPGDTEASDQLALLAPTISANVRAQIESLAQRVEANPHDVSLAIELADLNAEHGLLNEAESIVSQTIARSGKSLQLLAKLEALEIARLEHRTQIARQRATLQPDDRSNDLVARLENELQNRSLEIFAQQSNREPDNVELKARLALAFQVAEKYAQAVKLWEEIRRTDGYRSLACLQAGECLSHLQRFEPALTCFVTAIEADDGSVDIMARAYKRAIALAESTGRQELAERYRQMSGK